MNWFFDAFRTAIGKKILMAVTGLFFCLFLLIHLIGNLTLYGGQGLFISYVTHLHALGPLILVAEFGLLFFAVIHVSTGLLLVFQNWRARPVGYAVKKNAGGRTIGSATMPYTGLVILCFIVIHLLNFKFIDQAPLTVFNTLTGLFSAFLYIVIYTAAVIAVAIHVRHGFWSLFQTLGANHPKYMPFIQGLGIVFSLLIAGGVGFIPVYIGFIA